METKFKILKIEEVTGKYVSEYKIIFNFFIYIKILWFTITLYKKKCDFVFSIFNDENISFKKNKSSDFIQQSDKKFKTELDQFLLYCHKTLVKRRMGL